MKKINLEELTKLPELDHPPERVISLIPSITESLFDLGFGSSLVGITDYCVHPADKVSSIQRVGGPKNPDLELISQLDPQVVFVNQEENSSSTIGEILEAGIKVWMSFPKTVDESLDVLRKILGLYHTDRSAVQITSLRIAVDYARAASESQTPMKYFCPIWQDLEGGQPYWMTFNQHTYSHDVLSIMGGRNIFADRNRSYPLKADLEGEGGEKTEGRDTRYPRVTTNEINQADPDVILLPNEPFSFNEDSKQLILEELGETQAVRNKKIYFLDGSLITWHGTRLGKALQELPQYFQYIHS